MKRIIRRLTLFLIALSVSILTSAPSFAVGDVNNFEIKDYQIDYYLAKDSEGRSTLKTVESISAMFHETDQNHGIERAIRDSYDDHSTSLKVESVSDASGNPIPYKTRDSNDNTVLRIGDADTYVHGLQTYKITYLQRDVTKYFSNTNSDEFYWDINGTQWNVPINTLTARLHVDKTLISSLSGKQQCYQGEASSNISCTIYPSKDGFTATVYDLAARENVTIAVGFKSQTFSAYQQTFAEKLIGFWYLSVVLTFLPALGLIIWLAVRYHRRSHRLGEVGVIVPEYLPPKGISISTAGTICRKSTRIFSAQLIDLAVRHYLKIYQTQEKSFFKHANYELEIVKDTVDLKAEEREMLQDIFAELHVGARLNMETLRSNTNAGRKLSDNPQKLDKDIEGGYALRLRNDMQSKWFKRAAIITLVAFICTLSPWLLIVAITSLIMAFTLKPLTDKGLALSRYLKGLEMYIKVAETERLRILQGPDSAVKLGAPIDTNDKRQLVTLYERLLPYAILFGQEKEWNRQLGTYYESLSQSPSWYMGNTHLFNAAVFSTAVTSFNQAASYSNPSSASSGGSGGEGFSGGGGGGGGGGGW